MTISNSLKVAQSQYDNTSKLFDSVVKDLANQQDALQAELQKCEDAFKKQIGDTVKISDMYDEVISDCRQKLLTCMK